MKTKKTAKITKLLQLPIPMDLGDRLQRLADLDRRSKTAEALILLEEGMIEREARLTKREVAR